MSTSATTFAAWHKNDRAFFLAFIIVAWVAIGFGFSPSITERFTGVADYPAPVSLVVHVWSFFAWMTVLTVQILLIRFKRPKLHQTIGIVIVALIPVMAISGLAAEAFSQRFYAAQNPENVRFYIVPLTGVVLFTITATMAFLKRTDPPSHKRYILLATSVILAAGFSRWWGPYLGKMMGESLPGLLLVNWAGPILLILAAAAYDYATRGRLHRVLAIGVPAYIAVFVATPLIYVSDFWPVLVRQILGIAPV